MERLTNFTHAFRRTILNWIPARQERLSAGELTTIILISVIGATGILISDGILHANASVLWIMSLLIVIQLGSLVMLRYDRLLPARLVVPASLLLGLSYLIYSNGGIHDIAMIGFTSIMLLGSLAAGVNAPLLMAAFIIFVIVITGQMEMSGALVNPGSAITTPGELALLSILVATTAILIRMLIGRLNASLNQVRTELEERQRVETALRKSEAEYRTLFTSSPIAILILNEAREIENANKTACQMFACSLEELRSSSSLPKQILPENIPWARTPDDAQSPFTTVFITPRSLERADGTSFMATGSLRQLPDGRSQLILEDITDTLGYQSSLERTAKELRLLYQMGIAMSASDDLEEVFRHLTDYLDKLFVIDSFCVGIYDENTGVVHYPIFFNAGEWVKVAARDIHSVSGLTGEVIDKRKTVYIPDTFDPEVQKNFQIIISAPSKNRTFLGIPLITDNRVLGIFSMQSESIQAYSESEIQLLETLASQLAASIQKAQLVNELQELNAALEERVQARTSQLQLANKELESFAYSVSHDLRAPLRAILGFSEFLREDFADQLGETGQGYITRIQDSARTMNDLIDALLTLSRQIRSELALQAVPLSFLAAEISVALQAEDPTQEVEFIIQPNLSVLGDARLLRVVLENLLGNAWKYTNHKPGSRIEFGAFAQENETIYFVRDNGVGFNPDYAHRLFGVFQRLHRADEFPGHGIGLATVQRIIHRHQGRVWGEGEEGKGAAFYFTIGV